MNKSLPDWLPDEYDPDASLRERLPIMADIEGGIELHVGDDRGVVEVVGQPQHFFENGRGLMELKAGPAIDNWKFEIVVPTDEAKAFLRSVNPNQEHEAYLATRKRWLENIDVRIYGVDIDRLEGSDV